ncbi:MAG: Zn-dependent exopeptidase M28, partial [Candidatus Marinimicrobia bacterium]|nr:Zn-dependent exopeptidase M28 [Candidatus Neomarinimicrobiota bacterium]
MPTNFKQMTDNVFDYTQKLIDKFGPRKAGSKASRDCAEELYNEMKSFADEARVEEFTVRAGAFLGWIRILVLLYSAGTALLWLNKPGIASGLLFIGIVIMIFQFFLYKHAIDFLYPKKTGKNVIGSVEPEGDVKQQVIISGHHDSAPIFNFNIYQPKLYALRVVGGVGILFAIFLLSAIVAITGLSQIFITIVAILASIGALIVLQLWFFASKKATPGAGDNLVASVMALESLREIAKNKKEGKGLKHTRVIAISFDAEEEGLRGAYAYAKKHKSELQAIPTAMYNIDCPYFLEDLFFLTSDINGSVKLSDDLAETCRTTAERLGYKVEVKPIEFLTGGTDAAELAKIGVAATTMLAMPWGNSERASYYHTPEDTIDHVEKEAVKAGLEVFFDLLARKD